MWLTYNNQNFLKGSPYEYEQNKKSNKYIQIQHSIFELRDSLKNVTDRQTF
jgi:hypothetical protein